MSALLLLAALLAAAPLPEGMRLLHRDAEWVLAPGTGKGCRFVLDPRAEIWYGCKNRFLIGAVYGELRRFDAPFFSLAWNEQGLFAASGEEFSVYDQTKLRPLARFPEKNVTVHQGAGDAVYLAVAGGGLTDVYLAGKKTRAKLFTTKQTVTAAAGDGRRHFVALQRRVYGLGEDAMELLFEAESEVTALAYDPEIGLFYATNQEAGYIGSRYDQVLYAAPATQIRLAKGALYVLPAGGGVLRLPGLARYAELDFQLAAAQRLEQGEEQKQPAR